MSESWRELGRYGGVGLDLVLSILILGGIGHWLDGKYWPGHDWGATVGFLLGVAVGVRNLIRVAARMQRDIEVAEEADPAGSKWKVDENWVHDGRSPAPPEPGRNLEEDEEDEEKEDRDAPGA